MLETSSGSGGSDGSLDVDDDFFGVILTEGVIGNIGIGSVELKTVVSNVGIAISKEAAIATIVTIGP